MKPFEPNELIAKAGLTPEQKALWRHRHEHATEVERATLEAWLRVSAAAGKPICTLRAPRFTGEQFYAQWVQA